MSLVNGRGEPERADAAAEQAGGNDGGGSKEHAAAPRQATWFGVSEEPALPAGPFAGVVFNRPIDQVLSYHVPSRLERIIAPGQRLRVPLGQGNKLTVGYCVHLEQTPPPGVEKARIKEVAEVL